MKAPTPGRTTVKVCAPDPISQAGITSQLRPRPEIRLLTPEDEEAPQVVLVTADTIDEPTLRTMRTIQRTSTARGVVVTTHIDERQILSAAECRFLGIVRRAEATADRLVSVVTAAARGEGHVPPDLLGSMLEQVGKRQGEAYGPRSLAGLNDREVQVLRLVAEGLDTTQIAHELGYAERTIKNVLHAVNTRMHLNNRSHAVAYALRQGLI